MTKTIDHVTLSLHCLFHPASVRGVVSILRDNSEGGAKKMAACSLDFSVSLCSGSRLKEWCLKGREREGERGRKGMRGGGGRQEETEICEDREQDRGE